MRLQQSIAFLMLFLILSACGETPSRDHFRVTPEPISSELVTTKISPTALSHHVPIPWDLCIEPHPNWVIDFAVYPTPRLAEPSARIPFTDPIFGTCLVRVTDRFSDLTADDPSPGLKNEYSRVQSFNADNTLILVRGIEATWYLYDAASLQPLGQIPIAVEPRWDAKDPQLLHYFDETRLMGYQIDTSEHKLIHDFASDFPESDWAAVWTRYEGSPSLESRYWGLMLEDENWETVAFLVYDLAQDRLIAKRFLPSPMEVDSVSISPLGNYFLAYFDEFCQEDQLGEDTRPCGLMVYDRELQYGRGVLRIVGHSDIALDPQGREVLIYQDIDSDHIAMLDLGTGLITPLLPIDFSHSPIGLHFSGRAFNLPGWVLISTYSGAYPAATWMDDQIFAIELKPEGHVVRLAHTHSLVDENQEHDYWAEPHASANQDFTRILFTSNWGRSGTGEVEMYLISLPKDWPSQLP